MVKSKFAVLLAVLLLGLCVTCNKIIPDFTAEVIVSAEETKDWWEMQQLDEPLFEQFKTSKIMMRSIDLDENKIHSCYEYRVINDRDVVTNSDTFCFPSVVITGYRKSSTSALYNLLAQYPRAKLSPMKENCAFIGDRSIIQYFDSLPRSIETGDIIFDGCVDLKGNIKMRSLLREPNTYYLVLIRDFASWLWSAYNYWCQPEYDQYCFIGDHWTTPDVHHRSPETFHDIVMGSINGTEVPSPLLFKKPCEEGKVLFQRYVNKLWTFMPIENTIILASEDLESSPEYVWSRIASAIGLNAQHPKLKAFTEVRYNTQGIARTSKGADVAVSADKYKPGLYGVSKFQPMLESTREVLNQCWRDDCLWSSLVTGHKYAACHSAENNTREFTNYIVADPILNQTVYANYAIEGGIRETLGNMTSHLHRYFQFQSEFSVMPKPFLQMPTIKCEENFNHTMLLDGFQNSISMRLKTSGTSGSGGAGAAAGRRVLTSSSSSTEGSKKEKSKKSREGVLLLSTLPGDRAFVRNLIYYSTGVNEFIDVGDDGTVEGHDASALPSAALGPRGLPLCSVLSNTTDRKMLVGTDPKNVQVVLRSSVPGTGSTTSTGVESKYTYVFKTAGPTNCDLGVGYFDYVIYIVRDSLAAAWSSYQRSLGLGKDLKSEQLVHFDWAAWETAAISMLQNSSTQHTSASYSESTDIIFKIDPPNKMIFRIEDLMFSNAKMNLLKMIVEFPKKPTAQKQFTLRPDQRSNAVDSNSARNKLLKNLECAHLLAAKRQPNREAFTSRSNMDLAYASDDLLCKVKQVYQHQPLSLLSLQIDHNITCVDGLNTVRNIRRKCKVRYEKMTYLETPRLPPVLLTMHAHDMINTRLLIEHASGAYTGAMETNRFLTDLFPGEMFCGQRMSVVYANPRDVTIKDTRSGAGTVSLTNYGKKKCMKGSIRGFTHSLVIPRDPFMHVWREFHRQLEAEASANRGMIAAAGSTPLGHTGKKKGAEGGGGGGSGGIASRYHWNVSSGSHLHQYPSDMKARLLNISSFYNVLHLEVTHAYERLHYYNFDPSQSLFVSFEALINPVAPAPVVHNTHHHSHKTAGVVNTTVGSVSGGSSSSSIAGGEKFSALKEILQFAKFERIYDERVECAYKFMEVESALLELQHMNSFFLSHRHLICEMNKIFSVVLAKNKFKFIRLYSDVDCGQQQQQQLPLPSVGW